MTMSAPDQYSLVFLQAMNNLWFHQNIFMKRASKTTNIDHLSVDSDSSKLPSPLSPPPPTPPPYSSNDESHAKESKEEMPKPPERADFVIKHRRVLRMIKPAASSSDLHYYSSRKTAEIRKSCKSFSELEEEEVKGFMDLGFIFKEEEVSSDLVRVVPGLQKVGDDKRLISRPYLSEAWLTKKWVSPVMSVRMLLPSSVVSGADMKKHLRFWARTVANVVQES